MRERTLYCIIADPAKSGVAEPDMGHYTPKELAFKEGVSSTSVYSWIKNGLPVMREGKLGNIRIYYQDYIQWMIDCARGERPERDIPSWAYRFVKAATPKKRDFAAQKARNVPQEPKKELLVQNDASEQKAPQKRPEGQNGGQLDFLAMMEVFA